MTNHDYGKQIKQAKADMRKRAYEARAAQANKDEASRLICERVMALSEYRSAQTVMWYLHCRTEVRTRPAVEAALASDKRVVIPYCTEDERGVPKLGLWHLQSMEELVAGTWQILEPPKARWGEAGKEIAPGALDFVIVPGVGFDRQGRRLGNGLGYYDRLLAKVSADTELCAICFEAQVFVDIPCDGYDVVMKQVVTEADVYNDLQ